MESIPAAYEDLFDKESIAHVSTLMPDGTPQVTPVWVDVDDEGYVCINTVRDRQKAKNLSENPKVGLSITDPDDPYRYLSIRGAVEEMTTEGAVDHIDRLAQRYMDVEEYPYHDDEESDRVIVRIRPDRVIAGQ
ncbi:PPOX class F420-dependent oxidoreductase [Halostagnicola kamekurae]|uniref:PPOX class probable F420-dependent enzyme n=1 Tax=Halostagnicola kamekurae TaxID=619731 RepID=A0A1I6RWE7_9EURY|nr:PPOX class F420-dependent oxidoreductase [Halostagnicola kamekurae]SFS69034.1 PPOX class probable F420-dependent enzyme [Halostagnicola kamekurae]